MSPPLSISIIILALHCPAPLYFCQSWGTAEGQCYSLYTPYIKEGIFSWQSPEIRAKSVSQGDRNLVYSSCVPEQAFISGFLWWLHHNCLCSRSGTELDQDDLLERLEALGQFAHGPKGWGWRRLFLSLDKVLGSWFQRLHGRYTQDVRKTSSFTGVLPLFKCSRNWQMSTEYTEIEGRETLPL